MKEQLISFETAKLAKEKGLPQTIDITHLAYTKDGKLGSVYKSDDIYSVLATTQSLLQKWLREVHNISIWVSTGYWISKFIFEVEISYINKDNIFKEITPNLSNKIEGKYGVDTYEDTYEEALEVGLVEALKLIEL